MALIPQRRTQGTESSNDVPKVTQLAHLRASSPLAQAHASNNLLAGLPSPAGKRPGV